MRIGVLVVGGCAGNGEARPDAELVCLAVAQVLLRYHDEHHWLRAASARVGRLFPAFAYDPANLPDNRPPDSD
jgi:hypothetical protein